LPLIEPVLPLIEPVLPLIEPVEIRRTDYVGEFSAGSVGLITTP